MSYSSEGVVPTSSSNNKNNNMDQMPKFVLPQNDGNGKKNVKIDVEQSESIPEDFESYLESTEDCTDQSEGPDIPVVLDQKSLKAKAKIQQIKEDIELVDLQITKNDNESEDIELAEKNRASLFFSKASKKVKLWKVINKSGEPITRQESKEILLDGCIHYQMVSKHLISEKNIK